MNWQRLNPAKSLAEQGFRLPAEWEPHQGTWVSWPHNPDTWPGSLAQVREFYGDLIAAIAEDEVAHVNVTDAPMESEARRFLLQSKANLRQVEFHAIPTNDAWCRDYGALFVKSCGTDKSLPAMVATAWGYNAWGGKYPPFDRDQTVAEQMAQELNVPCVQGGMILEGGAIDVNGAGILLTTEECLLNPNRNPRMDRETIEQKLRAFFGVCEIVWLGGGVAGDDTDGHIDNLCRFVSERCVVTVVENDPQSDNYAPLQENLRRIENWRGSDGRGLEVIKLPTPPTLFHQGQRLPASYGNFLITNHSVLLPLYGSPHDETAQRLLQEVFSSRRVVGIDCTYAIRGLGAIHCLTQQVPQGES
jgi:agmatine deiminase